MPFLVGIVNPRGKKDGHKGEELTESELREQCSSIVGLPMFDDHNYKKLVGRIAGSFLRDGKLWIVGKINDTTKYGKDVWNKIQTGEYGGLSLGTLGKQCDNTKEISDRIIAEASPCPGKEGRRPGTSILLTLNSGSNSEQITMSMEPIGNPTQIDNGGSGGVGALLSGEGGGGSPFGMPNNIITDIMSKADAFIDGYTKSKGQELPHTHLSHRPVPTATPTTSSHSSATTTTTTLCESCTPKKCGNCHKVITERKINTGIPGGDTTQTKESTKSSIFPGATENTKKTDSGIHTSNSEASINASVAAEESKSVSTAIQNPQTHTSQHQQEKETPMELELPPENSGDYSTPDEGSSSGMTHDEGGASHKGSVDDDVVKNDQLDFSGAVKAPVVFNRGGGGGGRMPPPQSRSMQGKGKERETDESGYYQSPTLTPYSGATGNNSGGKRKAMEQPRNEKGQFAKKQRAQDESQQQRQDGASDSGSIDELLNNIKGSGASGDDSSVSLSRSELATLFARAKQAEEFEKERERMQREREELESKLREKDASIKRQSKHDKVNQLIENGRRLITTLKDLQQRDPEGSELYSEDIGKYQSLLKDADALYERDTNELESLNKSALVLTRASNTYNKEIAKVQGANTAQLEKFEKLLQNRAPKSFDDSSGRARGPPEVSNNQHSGPMGKFNKLVDDYDSGAFGKDQSAVSAVKRAANPQGESSARIVRDDHMIENGGSTIPVFYGASGAPWNIRPFKVDSVCRKDDPNKGIFDGIENDLKGGGFFGFTDVDVPGITGKEWYKEAFKLPGIEAVGGQMALPPPMWVQAQSRMF